MQTVSYILFYCYLAIVIVSLICYIPRIVYYFEPFKKHKKLVATKARKFAIVVPARNESKCIKRLLNSINAQTYNKKDFDVYVIVDNYNDPTINIVKDNLTNCECFVCENQKCKGDALDYCFKNLIKDNKRYDYYLIVDADNVLEQNALVELNNACESNADVICLNRRNLNHNYRENKKYNNWISNCSGLTHAFQNEMGNYYRSYHNKPLTFTGSGLAISDGVLTKIDGWPFKTLAEDYEFTSYAVLHDLTSFYADDSTTYLEECTSFDSDNKRRARWVNGFSATKKIYAKQIINKTKQKGAYKCIDYLYSLVPILILIFGGLVLSLSNLVLFFVSKCTLFCALWFAIGGIAFIYLLVVLYTIMALLTIKKYNKMTLKEKIIVCFLNPIYCSLYIPAFIKAQSKTAKQQWICTERIGF